MKTLRKTVEALAIGVLLEFVLLVINFAVLSGTVAGPGGALFGLTHVLALPICFFLPPPWQGEYALIVTNALILAVSSFLGITLVRAIRGN